MASLAGDGRGSTRRQWLMGVVATLGTGGATLARDRQVGAPPPMSVRAARKLPGPASRLDAWRILGPGGGGTMVAPTISPHDPKLVLEHCDMTGAYLSADGGQSWRMFNLRDGISTFAYDPGHAAVIYAGNAILWRSEDAGKTWSMVFPGPRWNTAERMVGDHADYYIATDDPVYPADQGRTIEAIAVDPANSRRLFIVFRHIPRSPRLEHGRPASLYTSEDRGASWSHVRDFGVESIRAIYLHGGLRAPTSTIYVVGESGVYIGREGQWMQFPGPAGVTIRTAAAGWAGPTGPPLILAITPTAWSGRAMTGGVYVSADGGRSWRAANAGLADRVDRPGEGEPPRFRALACSSGNAATAYLGFQGLRLGEGPANLFNGIAKTTNGGRHWVIVHREANRPSPNLEPSWIEERAPTGGRDIWFAAPYSLGVAPGDPDICYATDLFRTYRTGDGGKTWRQVTSVRVGRDRWTTRGLDVTTCYGVHFDPFDERHVFISYTDIGPFHSTDGGASWSSASVGVPSGWRNTSYWIVFDPEERDRLWGAFSGTHDLPRTKMWERRDPESFTGGVAASVDGGRHWTPSNAGMSETAATHILLDPRSPVGARVLYVCGFGRGVYKSTDSGKSWTLKNQGLDQRQPLAWRLAQAGDGTLYLVLARRREDAQVGDADDGALYRSTDGAEHWERVALPDGTNGPTALTIDPADPRRLYLSAWGVVGTDRASGGGVFLSTDGGRRWQPLFSESQHVYDVTMDPRNPRTLYLCGFDSAAYRSTDFGQTWTRIRGYNFKWGHRVIPDPVDPDRIYITTFGGSVWHGPATGDPHAVEDVLTPLRRA